MNTRICHFLPWVVICATAILTRSAAAGEMEDFQEAARYDIGCDMIPFPQPRSECMSLRSKIQQFCKTEDDDWKCRSPEGLITTLSNLTKAIEDMERGGEEAKAKLEPMQKTYQTHKKELEERLADTQKRQEQGQACYDSRVEQQKVFQQAYQELGRAQARDITLANVIGVISSKMHKNIEGHDEQTKVVYAGLGRCEEYVKEIKSNMYRFK